MIFAKSHQILMKKIILKILLIACVYINSAQALIYYDSYLHDNVGASLTPTVHNVTFIDAILSNQDASATVCGQVWGGTAYNRAGISWSRSENCPVGGFFIKRITEQTVADCVLPEVFNYSTGACEAPAVNEPKSNGTPDEGMPCVANPINPGTGNKYQIETDYRGATPFALTFQRFYNSDSSVVSTTIGEHWRHYYDRTVTDVDANTVDVIRNDGKVLTFILSGSDWLPDADVELVLEELLDGQSQRIGWQVSTEDNMVEDYDISGKLVSITNLQGQTQTLAYDLTSIEGGDDNLSTLDKITGHFGRTLTIGYDGNGRITTVTDPAGEDYGYSYDVNGNLTIVTYPDETPGNSNDNPTRIYHYEDVSFIHALTGSTDETGNRFATYGYDSQGRGILSEHAGGAQRFDLVYNTDGTVTVTDALGNVQTYHFDILFGVKRATQIDGDECTFCGGQSQDTTYDANGFIASRTDFNGNQTTFVNNLRGLQTSRTEAVGTPEERTITTEWHPDFRLPTKITEPGRITEFIYDTQGRLLSRKVSTP
jgi:YD repeat-containing protein